MDRLAFPRTAAIAILLLAPCFPAKPAGAAAGQTAAGQNAFSVLSAATGGLKDEKKIGYAISRTHDPVTDPDDRDYSTAEMAQMVEENAPILTAARHALTLPYFPPPVHDLTTKLPYFAKFRAIARLFALDAKVKEANGQWAAAFDSHLDAMALGEKLQSHTIVIGALVGAACDAIGMRGAWPNVDHLSAAESQRAARRLETIIAGHPPLRETLENQRRSLLSALPSLYRAKDPIAQFKGDDTSLSDNEVALLKQGFEEMHSAGLAAAERDFQTASTIVIRRSSGIWTAPGGDERAPGKLMVTRLLLTAYSPNYRFKVLLVETQARLLLTQLALRGYHEENGSYPQTLHELVPKYLKAVPADPFSANDTVKYGLAGDGPAVYSIGPDGVDDAAQAIDNPEEKD